MKIYIASSWRNGLQPTLVQMLREEGHEVYDFRNPSSGDKGLAWSDLDPDWEQWTPEQWRDNLTKPRAEHGYNNDFNGMQWADVCVLCMPCGRSAHIEAGWMKGAGKKVYALVIDKCQPDLMYKIFDEIFVNYDELVARLKRQETESAPEQEAPIIVWTNGGPYTTINGRKYYITYDTEGIRDELEKDIKDNTPAQPLPNKFKIILTKGLDRVVAKVFQKVVEDKATPKPGGSIPISEFINLLRTRTKEYKGQVLSDQFINGRFWECMDLIEYLESINKLNTAVAGPVGQSQEEQVRFLQDRNAMGTEYRNILIERGELKALIEAQGELIKLVEFYYDNLPMDKEVIDLRAKIESLKQQP